MKRGILLLMIFMALILLEFSSAEIIINGLEEVYNIGDSINASITIQKQENAAGYLEVYLDCGERILAHKKYYSAEADKKKEIEVEFPASLKGNCSIEAIFDKETEDSQEFEISDSIDLEYSINNKLFFPGEKLFIHGSAKKRNMQNLMGFARISLERLENKTLDIINGNFSFEFEIKKDAVPGKYNLIVEAFEKNAQEEIINYGKKAEEIEIKGKPTSIKIDSPEAVKPPLDFSAKISLLDQAGGFVKNGTIIAKLFNAREEIVLNKGIESGGSLTYYFSDNASRSSSWTIRVYYGDIFSEKQVWIDENKKIFVDIINSSEGNYALIRNIGNVDYNGIVALSANSLSEEKEIIINVSLGLAEEMEHPLELEGLYDLNFDGKNFSRDFPMVTGAAILPEIKISMKSYLYLFVVLAAAIALYFLAKRIKKMAKAGKTGKKVKEEAEPELQEGEKAFMLFFRFDKYVEETREIVEKENLSLNKLSDNLYYVLFYPDPSRNPEVFSYSLAKKVRNRAMAKGQGVSIAINSGTFKNKEKFLKDFSLLTRKMVEHASGGILVSEVIYKKIKMRAEKSLVFRENGASFRMYKV